MKNKTTIKNTIIYIIDNDLELNYITISKIVHLSIYRVKKYCNLNFIDLDKINKSNYNIILCEKRIKELKKQHVENIKNTKIKNKKDKALKVENLLSSKHKLVINSDNENKIIIKDYNKKIKFS